MTLQRPACSQSILWTIIRSILWELLCNPFTKNAHLLTHWGTKIINTCFNKLFWCTTEARQSQQHYIEQEKYCKFFAYDWPTSCIKHTRKATRKQCYVADQRKLRILFLKVLVNVWSCHNITEIRAKGELEPSTVLWRDGWAVCGISEV